MDLFNYRTAKGPNVVRGACAVRKRARRARTPKIPTIDPLVLWRSLSTKDAEHLGMLTVAFGLAVAGTNAKDGINDVYEMFDAVLRECMKQIGDLLAWHFPQAHFSGNGRIYPKLPVIPILKNHEITNGK